MYDSVKAITGNIPVPKLIKFVSEILINKMTQNSLVNACTHTWHIFMQGQSSEHRKISCLPKVEFINC